MVPTPPVNHKVHNFSLKVIESTKWTKMASVLINLLLKGWLRGARFELAQAYAIRPSTVPLWSISYGLNMIYEYV